MTSPDSGPAELTLADQRRAFARLLSPLFEAEWQRELDSPKPSGRYLMTELEHEWR